VAILLTLLLSLQDDAAAQAEAAVAQFRTAFKNPDVNARVAAVGELGKVQHAKTGTVLAGLLTADVPPVRRRAAEMLGQWQTRQAPISAILQAAVKPNQKEPGVLSALYDAMGTLRDKSAVDDVTNALSHDNDDVVLAAVRAAGKLGSGKAIDRLLGLWQSVIDYHEGHISTDGKRTFIPHTPELDRKYGMRDAEVRPAVAAITKKSFGDLNSARTWWNANRQTFKEQ